MLFNSFTFLAFFAIVLIVHNLPLPWSFKKFNLLWASYLFYAAWSPPFVVLLWISTITDWHAARRIHESESRGARAFFLGVSLAVNLGLLGFFKYHHFVLENFVIIVGVLGIDYQPPRADIVLPIGISFYTFQTLSYTLDIYRGKLKPWSSLLDFAMFVTFFPQLVAGPIVRAAHFLPQCLGECRATGCQLAWGFSLVVLGLFQKIVLADGLFAPVVERVYDTTGTPASSAAWTATIAFAGQIFCDFAGYSTIAIGVGMCLGFRIPDNFRFPYAAIGFSDFWQRWHISLSSWLRDYVYISLGGNRKGQARTQVNLMGTMLVGGLWHGASWTFVAWGAFHGACLILERLTKRLIPDSPIWHTSPVRILLGGVTFGLVCIAWVLFRADTFSRAEEILAAMLLLSSDVTHSVLPNIEITKVMVAISLILLAHWRLRETTLEAAAETIPWWLKSLSLAAMMFLMTIIRPEGRAFIYFQF